jgi:hypothetical protein
MVSTLAEEVPSATVEVLFTLTEEVLSATEEALSATVGVLFTLTEGVLSATVEEVLSTFTEEVLFARIRAGLLAGIV